MPNLIYKIRYYAMRLILLWCVWLAAIAPVFAQRNKPVPTIEDFSIYRVAYTYERELLTSRGSIRHIDLTADSTRQINDITALVQQLLLYKPIVFKKEIERKRIEGWRIQVYRGRSQEEASKVRQRCYEIFPNITPYIEYKAPRYFVRIGDFIEPYEYQAVLKRLKREFPKAIAVPDIITIIIDNREYQRRDNP